MSLVAVYDALKEAKVSDHKAAAAVEALESSHERYGELRADMVRMQGETNERFAEMRGEMDKRFAEMRGEMDKRFAETDAKMERGFAEARDERTQMKADIRLLKWMNGVILAAVIGILLQGIFG